MALSGMIFRIQRTIDWQWLCARLQPQEFRALTLLLYGHINSRVCLRWTWTPVVPGSEVPYEVYRTFPPVAPAEAPPLPAGATPQHTNMS